MSGAGPGDGARPGDDPGQGDDARRGDGAHGRGAGYGRGAGASGEPDGPPPEPRPIVERIGLAAIAVVIGGLFAIVAVASFVSGELFLAAMGAIGAGMTLWVGLRTLIRG